MTDLILYTTEDGRSQIKLRAKDQTVWLSQREMGRLFDVSTDNVGLHLKNILAERELEEKSVAEESSVTASDGKNYRTKLYNLDAILAVGYRVRSPRGVQFRRWASTILKEYLTKGFVMDDERLKNPDGRPDYFDEMLARIRDIRASEKRFYQKVRDLSALSSDYDKTDKATQVFFATVQNLLIFAVTRQTAAELITARANSADPHFGLLAWKGDKVRKADIVVAKNYLTEDEIDTLNRLVVIFLETAELRAKGKQETRMAFWKQNVDQIITYDRTKPKTTGQHPLEHRRPTARGDGCGRLPRLHAVLPLPALPLGQLRDGGEEGAGAGLPRCGRRRPQGAAGALVCEQRGRHPEFEKQMRRKVHYVIQPAHLWNSIANLARTQNGELLNTLQAGFKYIETNPSRAPSRACSPRST
jgi:hypothetical protein